MGDKQCGLCLSCGAPFAFKSQEVSFYDRPGNLSVLYINEKCRENSALRGRLHGDPKFMDEMDKSHVFHESHHQGAIDYMTKHHVGDGAPLPQMAGVAAQKTTNLGGPMPFFTGARKATGAKVATWTRPADEDRIDLAPLRQFIIDRKGGRRRVASQNLNMVLEICKACNALMTNEAMVGFLVGLGVSSKKNEQGPLIGPGRTPINIRDADSKNTNDLEKSYGVWTYVPTDAPALLPQQTGDDPIAPFVAYYLHCCMPFMADPTQSPFGPQGQAAVVRVLRGEYLEMAWILLMVTCTLTLIEQGKPYGDKPSAGMQQHYGVLDVYVSYFVWRLMKYEFGASNASSPDFVQWHQKYFWDAMRLPVFNGRSSQRGLGLEILPSSGMAAQDLFGLVCAELMDLYEVKLRDLVRFVTRQDVQRPMTRDAYFAVHYFVPPRALTALGRMWNSVGVLFVWGFITVRSAHVSGRRAGTTTSTTRSPTSASTRSSSARSSSAPTRCGLCSRTSDARGSTSRSTASAPRPLGSACSPPTPSTRSATCWIRPTSSRARRPRRTRCSRGRCAPRGRP